MILGSNCNSIVGCLLLWASAVVAAHWTTHRLDSTRRPMVNNLNLGFALVCKARKSNWTDILTYGCPWYNLKWDTLIDLHRLRKKAMSMSRDNFPEIYLAQIWTSIHSHLVLYDYLLWSTSIYTVGGMFLVYRHTIIDIGFWLKHLHDVQTRCINPCRCRKWHHLVQPARLIYFSPVTSERNASTSARLGCGFVALGRLVDPLVAGWTGGIVVW